MIAGVNAMADSEDYFSFALGFPFEEMENMPSSVTGGSAVAGATYLGSGFVANPAMLRGLPKIGPRSLEWGTSVFTMGPVI